MNKSKPISKNNSNVFNIHNNLNPKINRTKNIINETQKISLFKSSNYLTNIKNSNGINNNNEIYLLKNKSNNEKKIIQLSNAENNSLFCSSDNKIKRPTSCVNKKSEKIFFKDKSSNKKVLKFANQGKKIYLKTKTNNKKTINIDNINNININLDDKLNKY